MILKWSLHIRHDNWDETMFIYLLLSIPPLPLPPPAHLLLNHFSASATQKFAFIIIHTAKCILYKCYIVININKTMSTINQILTSMSAFRVARIFAELALLTDFDFLYNQRCKYAWNGMVKPLSVYC